MQNNQENLNSIQNEAAENNQPKNEGMESKDISMDDGGKLASLVEEQQHEARQSHHINANTLQMAVINKMLPKGYKFEILEVVQRMMEANRKRNTGLANYQIKKPEIQNEKKQQRILQRYQQKKMREQQKLEQSHSIVMNDKDRFMKQESQSITTQNQGNTSKSQNPQKTSNEQQNIVHPSKQDSKTKSKSKKEQNEALEIKNGDSNQNSKIDHQKPEGGSKQKTAAQGQDVDNQDNLKGGSQYDCNPDKSRSKLQTANDKGTNIQNKIHERDFKQFQSGDHARNNEQFQDYTHNRGSDDQMMNDEDNKKSAKSRKRPPPKNRHNLEEHEPQAKISKNKDQIRDGNNQNASDSALYKFNQQTNQSKVEAGKKDNKMMKGGSQNLNSNYQTKVFGNVDLNKIKAYDKYQLLLESMISHPELEAYVQTKKNQPLFLRIPEKGFDRYEELQRENDGEGFLNFQMILYRMRNKKYGAGKNIVKDNLIQTNIRNIFRICEEYFQHDDASMRISKILEMHFENELAVGFNTKGTNQRNKKGEIATDDAYNNKQKEQNEQRRSSSQEDYYDNRSGDAHQGRSNSSKSRKKKDKKDKKKDKKDKKKKNKDKDNRKDHDHHKSNTKAQPDHINSDDQEEEDDDDSQFEMKQQLFEIITKKLTTEQKKGIIPIVFQNNGNKKQKFEFDLFSLEPVIFKKLEEYVQNCLSTNDSGFKNSCVAPPQKQELNGYQQQNQGDGIPKAQNNDQSKNQVKNDLSDDVQNQINQKLRENKMSLDTEIHDGQNFQNFGTTAQLNGNECGPAVDSVQPQTAFAQTNARNQNLENRYDLIDKINQLENRQLRGIVPIVKSQNDGDEDLNQDDENQKLEFDLYELSDEKCIQLRNYIDMCLQQNEENKQKEENQKYMDQQIQMMIQDSQRNNKSINERTNQPPFDQNPQSYTADLQPQNMAMDPQNQVNESFQNNLISDVNNFDNKGQLQNNISGTQPQNISMNQSMKDNNGPQKFNQNDLGQNQQQPNGYNLNQNTANMAQNSLNNDSKEQDEQQKSFLITKLEQIKNTNPQATSLINFLSKQKEFILHGNEGAEVSKNQIQFDQETGNIQMNSLSLSQLILLISVFQSEQLQQIYIDLMNGDQNKNNQPQSSPQDNVNSQFQNYNPDLFAENEQQQLALLQLIEEDQQQNKQQINNHLQDQYAQLQQNQQLTQQLNASIQDPSNSHFQGVSIEDLQTTLQQTIKNEQILDQNIKNINTYMEQQTASYTLKIEEINKQLQQLRQKHADYLSFNQNNQLNSANPNIQAENNLQDNNQEHNAVKGNQYNNLIEQASQNNNIINYNNQQVQIINSSANDQLQISQPQGSPPQLNQQNFDAKQESSLVASQPPGITGNGNTKELPSEPKAPEKVSQKRGRKPKPKPDQQNQKNTEKNQLNDQLGAPPQKQEDPAKQVSKETGPTYKNNDIDELKEQPQVQQQIQGNLSQEQLESQPILPKVFENNQNQQVKEQISSKGYVQDNANQAEANQNEFQQVEGQIQTLNQGLNTDQSRPQNILARPAEMDQMHSPSQPANQQFVTQNSFPMPAQGSKCQCINQCICGQAINSTINTKCEQNQDLNQCQQANQMVDQSQNQQMQNAPDMSMHQSNGTGQQTMQLQQQYVMQEQDQMVQILPQSSIAPMADQQSVPQNPQLIEYQQQLPQHTNVIQDEQDVNQQQQQENNGQVYQMAQVSMQPNQMAQMTLNDQVTNPTNQDQLYMANNQLNQNNQMYQQQNINSNEIQYNQMIMQSNQMENPDTSNNDNQIQNQYQQEQAGSEIINQQQQNFQSQQHFDMNNQFQYDENELKNQMIMALNMMNQNNEQIEQRMQMINQLTQLQQNIQGGLQQLGQMQDQSEQVQQQYQDLINQFNQAQEQINQAQQEIQQYKLQQDQIEQQVQQLQPMQMQYNNQNNAMNTHEDQINNQQLQQQPSQSQNQNFQN